MLEYYSIRIWALQHYAHECLKLQSNLGDFRQLHRSLLHSAYVFQQSHCDAWLSTELADLQ